MAGIKHNMHGQFNSGAPGIKKTGNPLVDSMLYLNQQGVTYCKYCGEVIVPEPGENGGMFWEMEIYQEAHMKCQETHGTHR